MASKTESSSFWTGQLSLNSADPTTLEITVNRNCMIDNFWREEKDSHQQEILSVIQHIHVDNYFPVKHLSNNNDGVKAQT